MRSARERLASAARRLGSLRLQGELIKLDGREIPAVFHCNAQNASGLSGMVLDEQSSAWLIIQPEDLPAGKLTGRRVEAGGQAFEVRGKPLRTAAGDWRIDLKEIKP
ncbi:MULTISPECIES: hypothetical protein [Chromobacterium]|uniref:hypothetical protein n=1 Tax=Chromobacterium TaxID=535 RepID=UPI000583E773|nr:MULTISPECIES: hypothetical protein [Chromobacterium]KIA81857.1 hypothetical protein QR66_02430 [Chromobacterium piscinae]MBM2884901.1 hypothetical protein [Chromobacterium amazonense]MDE1714752.1 hypothetical protein [Chromobacterium amazonense]